jgi:hypothetical protein
MVMLWHVSVLLCFVWLAIHLVKKDMIIIYVDAIIISFLPGVVWYSSMLGKKCSLSPLLSRLRVTDGSLVNQAVRGVF